VVATDHAPHAVEDKDCEWAAASFGMLGLQTALSVVVQTMHRTGRLDWHGVADRMSVRPARIGRALAHGHSIGVGAPASLALVDADAAWIVDAPALASKSRNSPYAGMELPARVEHVMRAGEFTVLNQTATR
jgi:dihydroorotase